MERHKAASGNKEQPQKQDPDDKKKDSVDAQSKSLMQRFPYVMNCIIGSIITVLSIISKQYFEKESDKEFVINWHEVQTMVIVTWAFTTPIILMVYALMEKIKFPFGIAGKLFFDQFIFSPVFTAGIIAFRLFVEGGNSFQSILKITTDVAPKAVVSSWLFWIPVRFISMVAIPPVYHLVFGNFAAFFWNIIFAMVTKH